MAADLTVDNLCSALRFFFQQIVEHPENPVDQERGLVLHGTPGDDQMRQLMEAFGGEIKITIKEMPVAMAQTFSSEIAGGQQAVLWEPSKERNEEFREESQHIVDGVPNSDLAHSGVRMDPR